MFWKSKPISLFLYLQKDSNNKFLKLDLYKVLPENLVSKFLQEYLHLFIISLGNKRCNSIKKFQVLTYCKYSFKLASPCHDFQQHFLKSKLFWHNPLLHNPWKGNLQVKNVAFWNATPVGAHFFQGSHPSVKLLFKRCLVHKSRICCVQHYGHDLLLRKGCFQEEYIFFRLLCYEIFTMKLSLIKILGHENCSRSKTVHIV